MIPGGHNPNDDVLSRENVLRAAKAHSENKSNEQKTGSGKYENPEFDRCDTDRRAKGMESSMDIIMGGN